MRIPRRWLIVLAILLVIAGGYAANRYARYRHDRYVRSQLGVVVDRLRTTTMEADGDKWIPQDVSYVIDDRGTNWLVRFTATVELRYLHEFGDKINAPARVENVDLDLYYASGIEDPAVKWRLISSRNPEFSDDEFGPEPFLYDDFKWLIDEQD